MHHTPDDKMNLILERMSWLLDNQHQAHQHFKSLDSHLKRIERHLKHDTEEIGLIETKMCAASAALKKDCHQPSETVYVAKLPSALDAYTPQLDGLHVDAGWGSWRPRMPSMPSWGGRRQRVAPREESYDMPDENGRKASTYDPRQAPPREDYSDDPRRPVLMAVEELRDLANRLEEMMETNGGEGEMGGGGFRG